jgi:hypothetical protein
VIGSLEQTGVVVHYLTHPKEAAIVTIKSVQSYQEEMICRMKRTAADFPLGEA